MAMMNCDTLARKYLEEFPETTFTRNAIKMLLRSGCIPCVVAGHRRFYSYEKFLQFLEDGNEPQTCNDYGTVRRID